MKKLLALLLICLMLLPLGGCAFSTDGLLEAAPELIARSAKFNDIYFGEGIPYIEGGAAVGSYYPADADYLKAAGFATLDELKIKTAEVFSYNYCEAIFSATLSGHAGESGGYIYARYSSNQSEIDRDEDELLLVYAEAENILAHIESITYDYNSIQLGEVGANYAFVLIPAVTVFAPDDDHPDGYTVEEEMAIKFVYEGGWRIDSATY